jgi:hypothetical protein
MIWQLRYQRIIEPRNEQVNNKPAADLRRLQIRKDKQTISFALICVHLRKSAAQLNATTRSDLQID